MKRTHKDKDEVLRQALVALMSFSKHSLSPTQTTWARDAAGQCLWALGIEEFEGFKARKPQFPGEIIDLRATTILQNSK